MEQNIVYREEVVEDFSKYVNSQEHPERPVLIFGDLEMSLLDYLEQIEIKSELGISLYKRWEEKYDSENPRYKQLFLF